MTEQEFTTRLCWIHEVGHAIMLYKLFPRVNYIDHIKLNSVRQPEIQPTNKYFEMLDTLPPDEVGKLNAMVALAGGMMEYIITSTDVLAKDPIAALILEGAPKELLFNETWKREHIEAGMQGDYKLIDLKGTGGYSLEELKKLTTIELMDYLFNAPEAFGNVLWLVDDLSAQTEYSNSPSLNGRHIYQTLQGK